MRRSRRTPNSDVQPLFPQLQQQQHQYFHLRSGDHLFRHLLTTSTAEEVANFWEIF